MASYIDHGKIRQSGWKSGVCVTILVCVFLLLNLLACREQPRQTNPQPHSPPDLKRCTRIEIRYLPSTLESLFMNRKEQILLLTSEEIEYLESLETIVVDDPERIKVLANELSSGIYLDRGDNFITFQPPIANVICYHNDERLTSYEDYFSEIRTADGDWFHYNKRTVTMSKLTPQLRPFSVRVACAHHLSSRHRELRLFLDSDGREYPASKWCDAIVKEQRAADISKKDIMRPFKCPSAGEGECHYALNPDCEPNSPPDTVHLFETKAGWNQYGGPELFTFDNHDPRGGCVVLNDGTAKFIRTREELQQQRWK